MIGLLVTAPPALGSSSANAGIQKDDYIINANGENFEKVDHLIDFMSSHLGSQITLEIMRGKTLISKQISAGKLGLNLIPEVVDGVYDQIAQTQKLKETNADLYNIILTTAPTVEGKPASKTLDIISSECVFGMNMFKDIFAGVRDVVGGRSEAYQSTLRDAKEQCMLELRREAYSLDADAVVAVSLNYSEISGGSKSMMFLVAAGTAVKLAN